MVEPNSNQENINQEPNEPNQVNTTQIQDIEEYVVDGYTRVSLKVLPKVFTEGRSNVKISFAESYVKCGKYESKSGLTFEGCFKFNGRFKQIRGIHLILDKPILVLDSRMKLVPGVFEMKTFKDLIFRAIKELENLINFRTYRELLIVYDSWGFTIYDEWIEGKKLQFPIRVNQGNLYVSDVPKPPVELSFEKTKSINVYNHTIEFEDEIEKVELVSYGGKAILIRNRSRDYIDFKITSPDHMSEEGFIEPNRYFLITHPRPRPKLD